MGSQAVGGGRALAPGLWRPRGKDDNDMLELEDILVVVWRVALWVGSQAVGQDAWMAPGGEVGGSISRTWG